MYEVRQVIIWHGSEDIPFWGVVESGDLGRTVAYCNEKEDAQRIADALTIFHGGNLTVHVQIDGRDVAEAMMPRLASLVRHATGSKNF